jgi:hypothetical protein
MKSLVSGLLISGMLKSSLSSLQARFGAVVRFSVGGFVCD